MSNFIYVYLISQFLFKNVDVSLDLHLNLPSLLYFVFAVALPSSSYLQSQFFGEFINDN